MSARHSEDHKSQPSRAQTKGKHSEDDGWTGGTWQDLKEGNTYREGHKEEETVGGKEEDDSDETERSECNAEQATIN